MAEQIVSPGVFTRENDQSFITQQPVEVGAAIVGPTVKGPVEIPTVVTSYSQFENIFGSTLISSSQNYSFLTSISAYNYFQNGGISLLVTRVTNGDFTNATSTNILNSITTVEGAPASGSFEFTSGNGNGKGISLSYGDINYYFISSSAGGDITGSNIFVYDDLGTNLSGLEAEINASASAYFTASYNGDDLSVSASFNGTAGNVITITSGTLLEMLTGVNSPFLTLGGGADNVSGENAFVLKTISEGVIMNSTGSEDSKGALTNGTKDNVRWEITTSNTSSGTFTLNIRRGNDVQNEKTILETFTNLSLDPESDNYVAKAIGDTYYTVDTSDSNNPYVKTNGEYPSVSKYVYVSAVNNPTPNYFDNNGVAKSAYTSSIPIIQSGSFKDAVGEATGSAPALFYNNISTNTQGLIASDYNVALGLLKNKDAYQFNIITTPGLIHSISDHASVLNTLISNIQDRGDAIAVIDLNVYGSQITSVTNQASGLNSSYATTYWPWCQINNPNTGKLNWVPASTLIPGVYAFNDNASEPWFAPAGINRGGLSTVVRPERKLQRADRDTLYENNVNPIANFPANGTVVFGQKTLQKKASALDRVNVRRLLIALKSYIGQVANNLVFEQNSIATRNSFLAQVNPYLESVQQRQGVYAFKVVMDDSNNTPDVIDQNQLVGQIFLQPTRTAEFIILDFNVLPTGAEFPA